MKKVLVVVGIVAILAVGVTAFAHGPGWGSGYMMGPGYGMGYGDCSGPGSCLGPGATDNKFFEETADLRKELHNKKFEYMEAVRNPETDEKTIAKLEKELDELQEKIHEKVPKGTYGRGYSKRGGYGCRW